MLGKHSTYVRAAGAGALAGLLLFIIKEMLLPGSLEEQLLELGLAMGLGAIVCLGVIWARNHWWHHANRRHEVARSIDILRK